jgi:hypothetical protein
VVRAEQIEWKPWWPRWISIDWGFEHPAAVYWHAQTPSVVPAVAGGTASVPVENPLPDQARKAQDDNPRRIVTYREFVTHRTSPRELAREIVARSLLSGCHSERGEESALRSSNPSREQIPRTASRDPENQGQGKGARDFARDDSWAEGRAGLGDSYGNSSGGGATKSNSADGAGREKIDAIYLSPDAFARRTDEASIADQMGDVFAAAGFPRPIPADNDRVGGWMLMYQMLDAGEWLLTENCVELIRTIPNLVRDPARVEDIEKMDGDDPADAARYGLKSRYGAGRSWQTRAPVEQRIAERITSADPFGRSMQIRKFQIEEKRGIKPVSFRHRHR